MKTSQIRKLLGCIVIIISLPIILSKPTVAEKIKVINNFNEWLKNFKAKAHQQNISNTTTKQMLTGIRPSKKIMKKFDKEKQAEFKVAFQEYRKWFINNEMIQKGLKKYRTLQDTLARIHKEYEIPPQYLLAIWGVESRYGNHAHKHKLLPALVTLAYAHPRSRSYFRQQLIDFLRIHQQHKKLPKNLKGSWAGAMGQPQFLPSSYREYAVDFTGDGWADIWNSEADILASIANYVSQHGWEPEMSWGRRLKKGEKLIPGYKLITTGDSEEIRYAVTDNFHAVFSYNHSNHYTLTVCQLADALAQKISKKQK